MFLLLHQPNTAFLPLLPLISSHLSLCVCADVAKLLGDGELRRYLLAVGLVLHEELASVEQEEALHAVDLEVEGHALDALAVVGLGHLLDVVGDVVARLQDIVGQGG